MEEKEIERIKEKYKEMFETLENYDKTHKLPKIKKQSSAKPKD